MSPVDEAVASTVCPEIVRDVAEAFVSVVFPVTSRVLERLRVEPVIALRLATVA